MADGEEIECFVVIVGDNAVLCGYEFKNVDMFGIEFMPLVAKEGEEFFVKGRCCDDHTACGDVPVVIVVEQVNKGAVDFFYGICAGPVEMCECGCGFGFIIIEEAFKWETDDCSGVLFDDESAHPLEQWCAAYDFGVVGDLIFRSVGGELLVVEQKKIVIFSDGNPISDEGGDVVERERGGLEKGISC